MNERRLVTPGGEVRRLLDAVGDDEEMLTRNIQHDPQHWVSMVLLAVPPFVLVRSSDAERAWFGVS